MQRMGVLEKELLVVMATYEFRCCGIAQEIIVSIRAKLTAPKCSVCNADMVRIYSTTPAIFKAKGFYSTDK